MQTNLHTPRKSAPLLAVTAPEEIEFLVKESEVLTGQPGRIFVIAGAERLSYRVRWQPPHMGPRRCSSNLKPPGQPWPPVEASHKVRKNPVYYSQRPPSDFWRQLLRVLAVYAAASRTGSSRSRTENRGALRA